MICHRSMSRFRRAFASVGVTILVASCGSGGSKSATDTAAPDTTAAVSETVTTQPASSPPEPATTTTTVADTTSTGASAPPIVVDEAGAVLVDGQRYRFEIHGSAFEFDGVDGWFASRSGNSLFAFAPGKQPPAAFVSMMRLRDAKPSAGPDQVDLTGLAVPRDPYAPVSGLSKPDGTPDLDAVSDLPADWIGYIDGLPGFEFTSRVSGRLGQFDGELASFRVSGLPESPESLCATPADSRCITYAVEIVGGYYYSEGDEVDMLVTDVGGVPFEFTAGSNSLSGGSPDVTEQRDRLVESIVFVE